VFVAAMSYAKGNSPDGTITLIMKHIKNWLQHAGDKMRYRMKKGQ